MYEQPTRRAAQRHRELLQTARQLVRDGGFRELQMNGVAAAAGVAVGTIYRYFPSKAALCVELVATVSTRELDVLKRIAAAEGTAGERLRDAVRAFTARAFQSGRLAYAIIAEPVDPEVEDVRLRYRALISGVFRDLLCEGQDDGSFACADIDGAAACIVGAFMEAVIGPLAPGRRADETEIERAVEQIADFCLAGAIGRRPAGTGTAVPDATSL